MIPGGDKNVLTSFLLSAILTAVALSLYDVTIRGSLSKFEEGIS